MPALPWSPSGQQASPLSFPRRAALGSSAHSSLSRQMRPSRSSRSSHSWTALTARGKSLKAACASRSSPDQTCRCSNPPWRGRYSGHRRRRRGRIDRLQLAGKVDGNGEITTKVDAALPRGSGQSSGKVRFGSVHQPARRQTGQANRHLKWAFVACPSRRPAKPPTSLPSIAPRGAGSDSTSHYSMAESRKGKVPPSRRVRWPGLSRRPRLGCRTGRSPTGNPTRSNQGRGKPVPAD